LSRTLQLLLITATIQAFLSAPASPASADDARTERVNITFFDCAANRTAPSDVRVGLLKRDGSLSSVIFPEATPATVRHLTIRLAPGQYDLVVANGDCGDDLQLSVLPGLDRNVVALARSKAILTSNLGSISGVLPDKGWQVAIVFKSRRGIGGNLSPDGFFQVPAVVDGNAYYATHLPLRTATLRLYNQALYRWIEFDVGSLTEAAPNIVHNITLQDIESALTNVSGI
jgi:hypothetical protein